MNKFDELKQIFKGILIDLNLTEEQVEGIMNLVRTPQEMAKIVDVVEKNPGIQYEKLFEEILNIIEFDIIVNQ